MNDESVRMRERNYPYILKEEQAVLMRTTVALAGLGIGSVIAETLVRMGVGRLILVDGDTVELSNLNRQNYTRAQIGSTKVEATARLPALYRSRRRDSRS